MSNLIKLAINGTDIPLIKGSYKESFDSYRKTNQTEAGTWRTDQQRASYLLTLDISMTTDESTRILIENFAKQASVTAQYYGEKAAASQSWLCFISKLSADLVIENDDHRYYNVSFTLHDLEQ